MTEIRDITYEEILPLWKELWVDRVSPIEPTSAMVLPESYLSIERSYSQDIGEPVFLGAFFEGQLVGCNSFHRINDTIRSRGLYVDPTFRGRGIGEQLLTETIARNIDKQVWSYPKVLALYVYKKSGFNYVSPRIFDSVEQKSNHYVRTHSSH